MNSEMVILMPVYNPDERIVNYVKKLKENNYQVILINDGSKSEYHSLFEKMVHDCKIISYPFFKGKGYAIKEGIHYIKEHLQDKKGIIILENEYDLIHINHIRTLINKNSQKMWVVHHKGKRFLTKLFSMIYNKEFIDVDSELFAFSMNYIDQMMAVDENCYEVQSLIQSVQNNQEIEEIQLENKQEPFHLKNKTIQIMYVIFLHLIRFISSSIISSVIDVLLAWILLDILKLWMTSDFWRIALSSLIARILSTIVNYVINKKYVFKGMNNSKQTAIRFLVLTVIITVLSTLFVYATSSLHIMSEKLAKPVGDLLLFLLSYSAQTKWVFKNNER